MGIIKKTLMGLLSIFTCSMAFASNVFISCSANVNHDYLQVRLTLRNFNVTAKKDQAQFDLCLTKNTQTQWRSVSVSPYMGYGYYPRFHGHHHYNYGFAFDPFYDMYSYPQSYEINTLQLTLKNQQGQTVWQEEKAIGRNLDDTIRELINHIPLELAQNKKPLDYSLQDFQKSYVTPEEFEKIRLY
ncbi:hypothetical protein [Neisseria sp. Ec49-e6-T10]|uniref:hypothetical protein n=1 Tax=Neisseria sp. Ec49-e6-T10 TaxID=3140744 RepID=UPI003EBC8E43